MNRKYWPYLLILWAVLYVIALFMPAYYKDDINYREDIYMSTLAGYEALSLGYFLIQGSPMSFLSWCSNFLGIYFILRVLFAKRTSIADSGISFLMVAFSSLSIFLTIKNGSDKYVPYIAPPLWTLSLLALSGAVWLKSKPLYPSPEKDGNEEDHNEENGYEGI
jgi:hypothetical protein